MIYVFYLYFISHIRSRYSTLSSFSSHSFQSNYLCIPLFIYHISSSVFRCLFTISRSYYVLYLVYRIKMISFPRLKYLLVRTTIQHQLVLVRHVPSLCWEPQKHQPRDSSPGSPLAGHSGLAQRLADPHCKDPDTAIRFVKARHPNSGFAVYKHVNFYSPFDWLVTLILCCGWLVLRRTLSALGDRRAR